MYYGRNSVYCCYGSRYNFTQNYQQIGKNLFDQILNRRYKFDQTVLDFIAFHCTISTIIPLSLSAKNPTLEELGS
jgi:hypothetical protein